MFDQINQLYQQVILEHNKAPRNFRKLPDANRSAEGNNPLCGDRFFVFAKIQNDVIEEITFQGSGCAVSKASASMMSESLKGKSVSEAQAAFEKFKGILRTGKADPNELGNLSVFAVVQKFPMRVKCAALPWHAMAASLKGEVTKVSTE